MTVRELREKFLAFYESKGHHRFPAGSLVPVDVTGRLDESLLFNGAGMIQFKPFFRGIARPEYPRLMTCQPCVRTNDIEEVGDDTHLSFFEMLGNFSFGDYFKAQAIAFSWEFLTSAEWLGLDPRRLSFSIHEEDDEAYDEWAFWLTSAGLDPASRIVRLDEESNYWPAGALTNGPPGPCGPNSEMFYWTSSQEPPSGPYTKEEWLRDSEAGDWVEFWNDVFIQFDWTGHLREDGKGYVKDGMPELPFRSIDTGMGLERTAVVLGGYRSVYETDVFQPIFAAIDALRASGASGASAPGGVGPREDSPAEIRARRIVADHLRTASFCIAEGILPGNAGRGYVLRRLIRRATLQGLRVFGFSGPFLHTAFRGVVEAMGGFYLDLVERQDTIVNTLRSEEELFRRTVANGSDRLETQLRNLFLRFVELVLSVPGLEAVLPDHLRPLIGGASDPASRSEADAFAPTLRELGELKGELLAAAKRHVHTAEQREEWDAVTALRISGAEAFLLYDTFGFPLEVTQELAQEAGFEVDLAEYEAALKQAQARSRGASGPALVYGRVASEEELAISDSPEVTSFVGYECTSTGATIVRIRPLNGPQSQTSQGQTTLNPIAPEHGSVPMPTSEASRSLVALDATPFYAESGGQIGDQGTLAIVGGRLDGTELLVVNTTKSSGVFWHEVVLPPDLSPEQLLGQPVQATVTTSRRDRIRRNHTATHLLQAALRTVLGNHVTQAGSYVGPENLRFDFTHGQAMTAEELERVEWLVNEQALANTAVTTYVDLPIAEARAKGAMALFGEKYGNLVRMVEIGDFSRELCGGIHVRTTGEIGQFRIVSESSAASGVRRIVAVTGEGAYELAKSDARLLREAANLLKTAPGSLVAALEKTLDAVKDERRRREKAEMAALAGGPGAAQDAPLAIGPIVLWRRNFGEADPKVAATAVDDAAAGRRNQVTLAAVVANGKPQFIAKVGADAVTAGAHAGNLLREVAKIAEGGGGGRPDFATAGGKNPAKVAEALDAAAKVLAQMVSVSAD